MSLMDFLMSDCSQGKLFLENLICFPIGHIGLARMMHETAALCYMVMGIWLIDIHWFRLRTIIWKVMHKSFAVNVPPSTKKCPLMHQRLTKERSECATIISLVHLGWSFVHREGINVHHIFVLGGASKAKRFCIAFHIMFLKRNHWIYCNHMTSLCSAK